MFLQRIRCLKRPWEEGEEGSVTNYKGAHSRVQKAEALTPGDPAVWENQPTQYGDTRLTVLLSSPSVFLSLHNHFHSAHAKALGDECVAKLKLHTRRLNADTE